ncbi:TPA: S9 family peptidase, partial [Elizabethkingia anophelis]
MKLNTKLFITAGVVITTAMMNAQSATTKLPGDATLPSSKANLEQLASYDKGNFKYKVEDYFARPKASQFKISPDGQFLSYKEKDNNKKNHVYVKDLKSGKITKAI